MQFTKKECILLEKIGDQVEENKEYSKEEINRFSIDIATYIMNNSSKNDDIHKCAEEFDDLLFRFARVNY